MLNRLKDEVTRPYERFSYTKRQQCKGLIRYRDNFTCQICGLPGKDVDHIIHWKDSHNSTQGNLRTLCHRCNCLGRQRSDARLPLEEYYRTLELELAA